MLPGEMEASKALFAFTLLLKYAVLNITFRSFLSASKVVFLNVSLNVSIYLIPFISFNCLLRRDATLSMVLLSCISGSFLLMILIPNDFV